ncbi:reverse transcriptase domain-containing protein [Tanacetum coccineum]
MHTSKDDYLINSLRFVSAKESTQIYGAILPECLTSLTMKESKAYKTYLGYATDEEPVTKGKRVKKPAKKSTTKPAVDVIIKEAPVETKSKSKEKEKVDFTRGKENELLSETHPSGSGTVVEKPPSVDKITPNVTSEGAGDKLGVPDVTEDNSTEYESESWGNDEECMRTRSQARNRNRRQQQITNGFIVENRKFPMADNRYYGSNAKAPRDTEIAITVKPWIGLDKEPPRSILMWDDLVQPNETFNEAWERFKELLRQCPHHGFLELHQLDTFYNSLNTNDQDALDSAAGGNFLDKMPQQGLAIIESKSKVRYSRSCPNDSRASTNAPLSTSTPSNSFEFQQLAASLEDKMDIRMSRLEKMISEKNVTTPATVKAVEEVCVTCGSNHNFNNCPLTRNDFPVFHDNIHQFQQTAAVGNFVQRNPPNLANQMRPPGFNQPNVQNNQGNQSRYQGNNFNSNQNRGGNFNQNHQNNQGQVFQPPTNQPPVYQVPPYQAPTPQIQGVSKTDFENYVKANDAVLKNVQNQGQNLQNQMANVTSLLTSLCNNFKNSTSTSGTLPSQTVTNPREQINAITTRSGKTLEGPSTPLVPTPVVSNPQKEPEQNPETSTEKVQNPNLENTAQVPPPEEEESIFMEIPKPKAKKTVNMFKQLRLEIGLKDALVEMPKFNKWLSSLLRNKEKLEEIAITTVNAECSAIIMNKVPEKLEDPGKFLIPCALQELDRTSALA